MAATSLGQLPAAAGHLRRATRLADHAGDGRVRAEVALSVGWLHVLRGRLPEALVEAELAAAGLTGVDAARAAMLRGLVLAESGRPDDAEPAFGQALALLAEAGGDPLLEADIRTNRSIAAITLGHARLAGADLTRAEVGYRELGHHGRLAMVRHNQALLADLTGDLPTALRLFDDAEALYRSAGRPAGLLPIERAQTLLGALLVPEARAAARRAEAEFTATGNRTDAVQAMLLAAQAALLADDPAAAREAALRARLASTRQRRPAWAALAGFLVVQADVLAGSVTAQTRRTAATSARGLVGDGWRRVAVDLQLTLARLALAEGRPAAARQALAGATRRRAHDPAELRARAWHAEALVRLAEGRRAGARSALRAGLRVLDDYRAALGAMELRATAAGHAGGLARTGLDIALAGGDPADVLEWAERWRATGSRLPMAPTTDPELVELTARLRTADARAGDGRAGTAALERAVRDRARQLGAAGGRTDDLRVPALRAALADSVLVEYLMVGREKCAVVVAGDLPARLVRLALPDDLDDRVDALRHALRSAAAGRSATAWDLVEVRAAGLDAALFGPLLEHIGDRPLVVVPTRTLHALPWSALPTCADRAVTVSPSAALWLAAHRRLPAAGGVLVAAGPGLDHAEDEIRTVARLYPGAEALTGPAATVENCLATMDGAAVAHLAAHGVFRADSPLFSRLDLADGPITGFDLQRLTRAPHLVVLSACESGVPATHPGDELLGLAATLLAVGTANVVCTSIPVPDRATRELMSALHQHLRAGHGPAEALRRLRSIADDPVTRAAAAGFGCLGAG